jgi:hypothetical protein
MNDNLLDKKRLLQLAREVKGLEGFDALERTHLLPQS